MAAVFADFGLKNSVSMSALQHEAKEGTVDYFLHAGDISYDLFDNASEVGNEFMRVISDTFAKGHPYMVTVGNHGKQASTQSRKRLKEGRNGRGRKRRAD